MIRLTVSQHGQTLDHAWGEDRQAVAHYSHYTQVLANVLGDKIELCVNALMPKLKKEPLRFLLGLFVFRETLDDQVVFRSADKILDGDHFDARVFFPCASR